VDWQHRRGFSLQQKGSDIQQAAECQRQEAVEELRLCSPIIGNLWMKTDGSKKEEDV